MGIGNDTVIALDLAWQIAIGITIVVSCFFSVKAGMNGIKARTISTAQTADEIRLDVKKLLASDAAQDANIKRLEDTQKAHEGWIRRVEKQVC